MFRAFFIGCLHGQSKTVDRPTSSLYLPPVSPARTTAAALLGLMVFYTTGSLLGLHVHEETGFGHQIHAHGADHAHFHDPVGPHHEPHAPSNTDETTFELPSAHTGFSLLSDFIQTAGGSRAVIDVDSQIDGLFQTQIPLATPVMAVIGHRVRDGTGRLRSTRRIPFSGRAPPLALS